MGDARLALATELLKRLRAGDRLDEIARDKNVTVSAIRRFFESVGIERKDLERLRSTQKCPILHFPDDLLPFVSRSRRLRTRAQRPTRSKWSDDDILRCLLEASTMAYPLTAGAYDRLRDELLIRGPSAQLIALRFKSWTRACDLAGVECGVAPREHYSSTWSNRDLIAYVRDYVSTTYKPSFGGYQAWAAVTEGAPSAQTLRNRLGPWAEVIRAAQQSRGVGSEARS